MKTILKIFYAGLQGLMSIYEIKCVTWYYKGEKITIFFRSRNFLNLISAIDVTGRNKQNIVVAKFTYLKS